MQLTSALNIAQKATNLFAQNTGGRSHVYQYSDVGVTSLKTILDAMQLDLASQYQMQISTHLRTAAEFKEVAQKYGFLSGEILYGAFLPDSVYHQIVKQNPDPDGSIRAFREAQPTAESADLGHLETCESFYEYLTSLDPLTPTYWPLVYKRLRLDYDSNSIPLNRIHFRPGNLRAPGGISNSGPDELSDSARTTGITTVDKRPRRGILQGLLEKVVFNASITLPREHVEYLAKACRSAGAKSAAQVVKGNNPALFVSAVATTCQRWDEDICRALSETSSPKVTVRIRKSDFGYILPALNAESTEFGLHADQESDPDIAINFRANKEFCTFLIRQLRSQMPPK
jgi:hypothetical protein